MQLSFVTRFAFLESPAAEAALITPNRCCSRHSCLDRMLAALSHFVLPRRSRHRGGDRVIYACLCVPSRKVTEFVSTGATPTSLVPPFPRRIANARPQRPPSGLSWDVALLRKLIARSSNVCDPPFRAELQSRKTDFRTRRTHRESVQAS